MAQGWERTESPRSRGRTIAVALASVVLVALLVRPGGDGGTVTGLLDLDRDEATEAGESPDATAPTPEATETGPTITRSPRPRPSPRPAPEQLPASWVERAAPPDALLPHGTAAWDGGRRLYVYGGQAWDPEGGRSAFSGEAAVYDVADDTWTSLPPAPLEPRTGASVAWTGTELVVWGGSGRTRLYDDGAAYDPGRGRWRPLPAGPLSPRQGAATVWDGARLHLVGGFDHAGPLAEAAAWHPAEDRWETLPALPVGAHLYGPLATAVAPGDAAVLWTPEHWIPTTASVHRLVGDRWIPTEVPGTSHASIRGIVPTSEGSFLGLHAEPSTGSSVRVALLPPDSMTWEVVGEDAVSSLDYPRAALVGDRYLLAINHSGAVRAYDLDAGTWAHLPASTALTNGQSAMVGLADGVLVLTTDPTGAPRQSLHRLVLESPDDGDEPRG